MDEQKQRTKCTRFSMPIKQKVVYVEVKTIQLLLLLLLKLGITWGGGINLTKSSTAAVTQFIQSAHFIIHYKFNAAQKLAWCSTSNVLAYLINILNFYKRSTLSYLHAQCSDFVNICKISKFTSLGKVLYIFIFECLTFSIPSLRSFCLIILILIEFYNFNLCSPFFPAGFRKGFCLKCLFYNLLNVKTIQRWTRVQKHYSYYLISDHVPIYCRTEFSSIGVSM